MINATATQKPILSCVELMNGSFCCLCWVERWWWKAELKLVRCYHQKQWLSNQKKKRCAGEYKPSNNQKQGCFVADMIHFQVGRGKKKIGLKKRLFLQVYGLIPTCTTWKRSLYKPVIFKRLRNIVFTDVLCTLCFLGILWKTRFLAAQPSVTFPHICFVGTSREKKKNIKRRPRQGGNLKRNQKKKKKQQTVPYSFLVQRELRAIVFKYK